MYSKISQIYLVNRYGDNIDPCLVQLLMLNDSDKVLCRGTATVLQYSLTTLYGILSSSSLLNRCSVAVKKPLKTVVFNESSVIAVISKLKANLSAGPDGLPPILFKELKHSLARSLALLYQQLLSVGSVPDDWKSAIITPVFKKVQQIMLKTTVLYL